MIRLNLAISLFLLTQFSFGKMLVIQDQKVWDQGRAISMKIIESSSEVELNFFNKGSKDKDKAFRMGIQEFAERLDEGVRGQRKTVDLTRSLSATTGLTLYIVFLKDMVPADVVDQVFWGTITAAGSIVIEECLLHIPIALKSQRYRVRREYNRLRDQQKCENKVKVVSQSTFTSMHHYIFGKIPGGRPLLL